MSLLARIRARLSGEAGFTLPELLAAMVIGGVILTAAATIMQRSFFASNQIADRVESVQRGRHAMDMVTRQLRSSVCVGSTLPLLAGSASSLTFTGDLTNGSAALPTQKRVLTFAPGTTGQTLTQTTYAMTAGPPTSTTVTWGTTGTTSTLLTGAVNDGSSPFFEYWGWDTALTTPVFRQLTAPLSAADIARVTEIRINFAVAPEHASTHSDVGTTLNDRITLPQADPNQTDPNKKTVTPTC